jgi:UDP-N-acetylglucosamine diphosphorylase/glucosamine-1-phosphate N-acetyltransferase
VGEILFGCLTLRERAERSLKTQAAGHLTSQGLAGFQEPGAPSVISVGEVPVDVTRILLSSRCALDPVKSLDLSSPAQLRVSGQAVGWVLPAGAPLPSEQSLLEPDRSIPLSGTLDLSGKVLEWPWSLVEANPARIEADVVTLQRGSSLFGLTDVHIIGDQHLSLGHDARVEPGVVLDVREGPIRLDARTYVQAPARLTGPLYVGEDTLIFGGSVGHSSIGPVCKVRGEIDSSILLGYCNKAHDGYLGHALLGRWVNLGAMTTNSDLKNNYSNVRVRMGAEEIDTQLIKVGCFLGDHVKTGIGTLIPTGGVVGAGSNVFGGKILPRYVPPFSWGAGAELVEFRLEELLQVAEAAMGRRKVELTPGARDLLRRAWEGTRAERKA